jgi:hypothetical protein
VHALRNLEAQKIIRSEWTPHGFAMDMNNAVKYSVLNFTKKPNKFNLYKMEIKKFYKTILTSIKSMNT